MTTTATATDNTSAFPLTVHERWDCAGTRHLLRGESAAATWVVYITLDGFIASAHLCDECKASVR
jgi:hypothetical protein